MRRLRLQPIGPRTVAHYQPANSCLLASNQGKDTTIGFLLARSSQPWQNHLHRRSHAPPHVGGCSGTPSASSKPACASACWAHAGPRLTTSAAQDPIRPEPNSNLIQTKPELNPNRLQKKREGKIAKKCRISSTPPRIQEVSFRFKNF